MKRNETKQNRNLFAQSNRRRTELHKHICVVAAVVATVVFAWNQKSKKKYQTAPEQNSCVCVIHFEMVFALFVSFFVTFSR